MKNIVFLAFYLILNCFENAIAGGEAVGGGSFEKIEPSTIQYLLENGDLKNAILNYIRSIKIEDLASDTPALLIIKKVLKQVTADEDLQKDILTPHNYVFNRGCQESESDFAYTHFACTLIGDKNGQINFEINKIAKFYQNLSSEQLMIRLGSLAIHEHIHHFQDPKRSIELNENEAYLISDYVKLTAITLQVSLLNWRPINYDKQSEPISIVKYYSEASKADVEHSEYIKVTKTYDLRLEYERCFNDENCIPLSNRKLNLVEAWTWGEHLSSQDAVSYYSAALILVPAAFILGSRVGGYGIVTGFMLMRSSKIFLNLETYVKYGLRLGSVFFSSITLNKLNSALNHVTSTNYIAIQNNNDGDAIIFQPESIDNLAFQIKEFIDSAPVIPVSKEALIDWNTNR